MNKNQKKKIYYMKPGNGIIMRAVREYLCHCTYKDDIKESDQKQHDIFVQLGPGQNNEHECASVHKRA